MSYDIIGDIHGYHVSLIALLEKLGYRSRDGAYHHPERQVIFLGDFVDRGPGQRETIELVRGMIEAGSAKAIMGNHELNAIGFYTPDAEGDDYLRPHLVKNVKQHQVFLDAFADDQSAYSEVITWFKSLPLWLELDGFRCIHACWDEKWIAKIAEVTNGKALLSDDLIKHGFQRGTWQFEALETLLKGKEIPLPEGHFFHDKEGTRRHNIRVRWWDRGATDYRSAYMGPESARTDIPDDDIAGDHLVDYRHDLPPVFLGHYWLEAPPKLLAENIACLDYSVAKPGGMLTAYRWSGEKALDNANFVSVNRVEP